MNLGTMPEQLHFPWIPQDFQHNCWRKRRLPRRTHTEEYNRPVHDGREVVAKLMNPKCCKPEELSTFERRLMLAMGLKDVRELDELLAAPISQEAADHAGSPDEQYELQEKLEAYMERE